MSTSNPNPVRGRWFTPIVAGAGILAAVAMGLVGLSLTPAFSGFTASINNNANSIGTGTLLMTETQGGTTCLSSASGTVTTANSGTCAINKFNGTTTAVPGTSYTSTIAIKNNGSIPANTFTLTPAGCTQSNNGSVNGTATNFCGKVNITISDDTNSKCVFPASASACVAPSSTNTLTSLGTTAISLATPLAAGATRNYTFTVQVDSSVTNDYQGLLANEQLNWAFAS